MQALRKKFASENVLIWKFFDHIKDRVAYRFHTCLRKEIIGVTWKEMTERSVSTIFASYLEFGAWGILSV